MRIKVWLEAFRLKTLPAVIAPVVVAGAMAAGLNSLNFKLFLQILFFGLSIQILTNLVNDLCDFLKGADTANRTGPRRAIQSGQITTNSMKFAIGIAGVIAALLGLSLASHGGVPILITAVLSIVFAFAYTAGPFPLAYLGLGDIFVFIFFGPVATGASYYLLAKSLPLEVLLIGASLGMLSTAILVVNNVRDYDQDKEANKKTLVVRFGERFGRFEYVLLLTFAAVIPIAVSFLPSAHRSILFVSLFILPAFYSIRTVYSSDDSFELNMALENTGKLLILYTLLFVVLW